MIEKTKSTKFVILRENRRFVINGSHCNSQLYKLSIVVNSCIIFYSLTLRFLISVANDSKFSVPWMFILAAISSGSLNFTVAAQWHIKFTFSINQSRSFDDKPIDGSFKSPSITLMDFANSGFSFLSRSNNYNIIQQLGKRTMEY